MAAQVAIWAVLLSFCLGLPRYLVVCTGPHCDSQVEFVHSRGSCCEHEHPGTPGGDTGPALGEGCGGCVDVALAIAVGPLPERVTLGHDSQTCLWQPGTFCPAAPRLRSVELLPPTTGPPRTDQRTGLLASTRLLL